MRQNSQHPNVMSETQLNNVTSCRNNVPRRSGINNNHHRVHNRTRHQSNNNNKSRHKSGTAHAV